MVANQCIENRIGFSADWLTGSRWFDRSTGYARAPVKPALTRPRLVHQYGQCYRPVYEVSYFAPASTVPSSGAGARAPHYVRRTEEMEENPKNRADGEGEEAREGEEEKEEAEEMNAQVELEEGEEGEKSVGQTEVAPALIAVHPSEKSVVVAAGAQLRAFDLRGDCSISLLDDSAGPSHTDAIRAICFSAKGRLFASAGDDKLVKVWNTDDWHGIRTVCSEKRVTAVAISNDDLFLTFADKFGVVWTVKLNQEDGENRSLVDKKPAPLFAHYCSIITSLVCLMSCIHSHSRFSSGFPFVREWRFNSGYISNLENVRLWDFISGCLLDTCQVGAKAALSESNAGEDACPAVTDLCTSADGSLVVVAIQSFPGVMLLSCNFPAKTLSVAKIVSMGDKFIPTSLGMGCSTELLWMVTGASNLSPMGSAPLACVKVISGLQKGSLVSSTREPVVLGDDAIPGGTKLLEHLQGGITLAKQEKALAAAAEAVKMAIRNLLIKRQYPLEKREFRKKGRNDKKHKQDTSVAILPNVFSLAGGPNKWVLQLARLGGFFRGWRSI
ncbi:hypothetical protein ACLOJK_005791 [Asimina triloba]